MQPTIRPSSAITSPHIRSIAKDLILALITCGIYNAVVQRAQMNALNDMLGEQKYSFWGWVGLCIITCGLYHVYHEYRMMSDICVVMNDVNKNEPILALIVSFFGFTLVIDAIQQAHINRYYGTSRL